MTQISEAKQVSISKTSETLYCITHEAVVKAEQGLNGLKHADEDWREEVFFCHFPDGWAVCPPPADLTENWADQPDESREDAELLDTGNWLGME